MTPVSYDCNISPDQSPLFNALSIKTTQVYPLAAQTTQEVVKKFFCASGRCKRIFSTELNAEKHFCFSKQEIDEHNKTNQPNRKKQEVVLQEVKVPKQELKRKIIVASKETPEEPDKRVKKPKLRGLCFPLF